MIFRSLLSKAVPQAIDPTTFSWLQLNSFSDLYLNCYGCKEGNLLTAFLKHSKIASIDCVHVDDMSLFPTNLGGVGSPRITFVATQSGGLFF